MSVFTNVSSGAWIGNGCQLGSYVPHANNCTVTKVHSDCIEAPLCNNGTWHCNGIPCATVCTARGCSFINITYPAGVVHDVVTGPGCSLNSSIDVPNASSCVFPVGGVDCGRAMCLNEVWQPPIDCIPCVPFMPPVYNLTIQEDSQAPVELYPIIDPIASRADCTQDAMLVTLTLQDPTSGLFDPTTGFVPYYHPANRSKCTVSVVPNVDVIGTAWVTLVVRSPIGYNATSMRIAVRPVNDVPGFDAPTAEVLQLVTNIPLNNGDVDFTLDNVHPGGGFDEDYQTLTITATSSNTSVVQHPPVTYIAVGQDGQILFNSTYTGTPPASRRAPSHATSERAVQHQVSLKIKVVCAGSTAIVVESCDYQYCQQLSIPVSVGAGSEAGCSTAYLLTTYGVPSEAPDAGSAAAWKVPTLVAVGVLGGTVSACCCCWFFLVCCRRRRRKEEEDEEEEEKDEQLPSKSDSGIGRVCSINEGRFMDCSQIEHVSCASTACQPVGCSVVSQDETGTKDADEQRQPESEQPGWLMWIMGSKAATRKAETTTHVEVVSDHGERKARWKWGNESKLMFKEEEAPAEGGKATNPAAIQPQ